MSTGETAFEKDTTKGGIIKDKSVVKSNMPANDDEITCKADHASDVEITNIGGKKMLTPKIVIFLQRKISSSHKEDKTF